MFTKRNDVLLAEHFMGSSDAILALLNNDNKDVFQIVQKYLTPKEISALAKLNKAGKDHVFKWLSEHPEALLVLFSQMTPSQITRFTLGNPKLVKKMRAEYLQNVKHAGIACWALMTDDVPKLDKDKLLATVEYYQAHRDIIPDKIFLGLQAECEFLKKGERGLTDLLKTEEFKKYENSIKKGASSDRFGFNRYSRSDQIYLDLMGIEMSDVLFALVAGQYSVLSGNIAGATLRDKPVILSTSSLCMHNCNAPKAIMHNAKIDKSDFSYANIPGTDMRGTKFSKCDFSGANMEGVEVTGNMDLKAANEAALRKRWVPQSDARSVEEYYEDATFVECNFAFANLKGVNFSLSDPHLGTNIFIQPTFKFSPSTLFFMMMDEYHAWKLPQDIIWKNIVRNLEEAGYTLKEKVDILDGLKKHSFFTAAPVEAATAQQKVGLFKQKKTQPATNWNETINDKIKELQAQSENVKNVK